MNPGDYRSIGAFAVCDPTAFVAWCDQLRAAGVVKLGALVLGAKPRDPVEAKDVDPDAARRREHDTMFAASRIKPPFLASVKSDSGTPRILVQRQARDEATGGTKSQR